MDDRDYNVTNSKFVKRVFRMFLGALYFTVLITSIVGGLVEWSILLATRDLTVSAIKYIGLFALLIFILFVACVILYICTPKIWNLVHKSKRETGVFPLLTFLPDIYVIVDFLEDMGTPVEEWSTNK